MWVSINFIGKVVTINFTYFTLQTLHNHFTYEVTVKRLKTKEFFLEILVLLK